MFFIDFLLFPDRWHSQHPKTTIFIIPADQNILQHINSGRKTLEGIVIESPSSYPDKKILIVRCLRILKDRIYIPIAGDIRLVIPAEMSFSYGDFIRFH